MGRVTALLSLSASLTLLSCADPKIQDRGTRPSTSQTRQTLVIRGAGTTFPAPIYSKWALAYFERAGVKLDYQATGSLQGVAAVRDGKADFGATDVPLTPKELQTAGLAQFPSVIGAVVPVVNLPDLEPGAIKLSGAVLAGVFLGQITQWNDPKLAALNPELTLPDEAIIPVYRKDASGTTWLFTRFVDSESDGWHRDVGVGTTVSWPAGVGAQGSHQMAKFIRQFKYTIGYVELPYALENALGWAQLRNPAGRFVGPNGSSVKSAVDSATWTQTGDLRIRLTNQPGVESWPMVGASYILVPTSQQSAPRAVAVLEFFDWALRQGGAIAEAHHYVAIPEQFVPTIEEMWHQRVRRPEGAPLWTVPGTPRRDAGHAEDRPEPR